MCFYNKCRDNQRNKQQLKERLKMAMHDAVFRFYTEVMHPSVRAVHLVLSRKEVPIELRNIVIENYFPFLPTELFPLTFTQFQELLTDNLVISSNYIPINLTNFYDKNGLRKYKMLRCKYDKQLQVITCTFGSLYDLTRHEPLMGKCHPNTTLHRMNAPTWWPDVSINVKDYTTTEQLYKTILKLYRYMLLLNYVK